MGRHRGAYERVTGVRVVPGSLSVVLEEPGVVEAPPMRLGPPEVGVGTNIVPGRPGGIPGFIRRKARTNPGSGDHPTTVIEIAAAVRLRDALGVVDGDVVIVELA